MGEARAILHGDLNSFYASVEIMLDPSLRGKAVAVCGSTEDRHGIVLAKSEPAKKTGVKTGMVNWEAKRLCPQLIIVPPQYEQYLKYSKLTRAIYQRYTDEVEPFGMDECWLDVSASRAVYGDELTIAQKIKKSVREELGITVSIGVSFNKVFAKLGSDLKKPDAITIISEDDYKEKVWPLPASSLIYFGRAAQRKLSGYGIRTIGDVANAPADFLKRQLGKNGEQLWLFANGADTSRVMHMDYQSPVKSIGRGITCTSDLQTADEVWRVILHLAQDIGHKLWANELCARGVQLTIKNNELAYKQYQIKLDIATQSAEEIAMCARRLFNEHYGWHTPVRAVTVRAINLIPKSVPQQLLLFDDAQKRDKRDKLEAAVEDIRSRFGKWAVYPAALMGDLKIPGHSGNDIILPGLMCPNT